MAGEIRVELGNITQSILAKLESIEPEEKTSKKKRTIHRIPTSMRQVCPDAYEPKLVSIGPLHHGNLQLQQMEQLKCKYLREFITRSPRLSDQDSIATLMDTIVQAVRRRERDVREQYSVDIGMGAGELVELLVLDGCFLIELFIKQAQGKLWEDATWNVPLLRKDLLLLENQIPFSVLKALFKEAFPSGLSDPPASGILDLALPYLHKGKAGKNNSDLVVAHLRRRRAEEQWSGSSPPLEPWQRESVPGEKELHGVSHLLHLNHIRHSLHLDTAPTTPQSPSPDNALSRAYKKMRRAPAATTQSPSPNNALYLAYKKMIRAPLVTCFFFFVSLVLMCKIPRRRRSTTEGGGVIPSAKNLKDGGITFSRKGNGGKESCLDVSFEEESGRLEIPFLSLNQGSDAFFRNLIAFEQCCAGGDVDPHFTAYATFMDNLIDTEEDVEILVSHGIIQHKLGSNSDVANLFNNLCKGAKLTRGPDYLDDLRNRVSRYCAEDRHRWRAALVNTYFHSPWARASLFAALILLLLTFGATFATVWQTVYAVRAYKKQFH